MNITPVKDLKKGEGPYTKDTARKMHSERRFPHLIYKVGNTLFFDWDEWETMAAEAKAENIKRASKLRAVKV